MATLEEQIKKAKADLTLAKGLRDRADSNTKDTRYVKFADRPQAEQDAATAELTKATQKVNQIQKYLDNLQTSLDTEKEKLKITGEDQGVSEELQAARQGITVEELRANKNKALAEVDEKRSQEQSAVDVNSFTKDIEVAGQKIAAMSAPARKTLAQSLNAAYNLNLPLDGVYSTELKSAYLRALSDSLTRSLDFNRNIPVEEFLVVAAKEGTYKAGGKGGGADLSGSISDPTRAAALINNAFKTQLNREPTAEEVAKYTKILNSAEKKNPFKNVNGITTGGLDKEQFLKDELVKLPEFSQKKTEKADITSQSIAGLAKANGLNFSQDQINAFTQQIENGTDIKTIQNQIRSIAGNGMPDTVKKLLNDGVNLDVIYSPYRNAMASTLEINPASIDLNDSTLRSAIGPDKEMPIYEFERNLRKDSRWQYTNNAREKAYSAVNRILQDFGFRS